MFSYSIPVHYELNYPESPKTAPFIFDAAHISAVSSRSGRVKRASKGSQAVVGPKAGSKRTRDLSPEPKSADCSSLAALDADAGRLGDADADSGCD